MSMFFYGAISLHPAANAIDSVVSYWTQLAAMHNFSVRFDLPSSEYFRSSGDENLSAIFGSTPWHRFMFTDSQFSCSSDELLFRAAEGARELIHCQTHAHAVGAVWPWVPEWRGLYFLFWHEYICDAYLIIEDPSGDAACLTEARYVPVMDAFNSLWIRYCCGTAEEASVFRLNLSSLSVPRGGTAGVPVADE